MKLMEHYSVQTQQRDGDFGFTLEIENEVDRWCSPWVKIEGATSHDEAMVEARRQGEAMMRALA